MTYPGLVGDGMTAMQAYAKLLDPNDEMVQKPTMLYPTLGDLSSYTPPLLLHSRYPTTPDIPVTMGSYQVLGNTATKTTDSVQNPITRSGDPTYPLSSNKVNMFTSNHTFPTMQAMQAGFSLSPNNLLLSSPQYQLPIIYHSVQDTPTMPSIPSLSHLSTMSNMPAIPANLLSIPSLPPTNSTMSLGLNQSHTVKVREESPVNSVLTDWNIYIVNIGLKLNTKMISNTPHPTHHYNHHPPKTF